MISRPRRAGSASASARRPGVSGAPEVGAAAKIMLYIYKELYYIYMCIYMYMYNRERDVSVMCYINLPAETQWPRNG